MLTARGWWFFVVILLQIGLGVILSEHGRGVLAVIGITLLAWFCWEWLRFHQKARLIAPQIRFERQVRDGLRTVPILWAGREFQVAVEIWLESGGELPYVILHDRFPVGIQLVWGRDELTTALEGAEVATIRYRFKTLAPGSVRFEGLSVQIADLQGFFAHRVFIRQPEEFPVLPPLTDAEGKRRGSKSHNILPPPGVHRLRSPGGGSELLDLRDYRPGDPPKMIAWKPSARRDRLITKEFESEVPVRCTLFLDTSQSARLGPARKTMVMQLTRIASGVAQAAISDRDHVGLVVFDEEKVEILRPARTRRHLIQLLHRLADAARLLPMHVKSDLNVLMQLGLALGYELYPELLRRDVNRLPMRMFWEPLLDSRRGWMVLILILMPLLVFWAPAAGVVGATANALADSPGGFWVLVGIILALPPLAGLLIWLIYGLSGPSTHRMRRKRLAALFCAIDDSPPGELAQLTFDDERFARRLQAFLAEHQVRYPVAIYDELGRYQFRSAEKVEVLARALNRSVLQAHDNELFVILADLIELDEDLDPLLRTIKVAMARHHHAIVICPWLPDIPAPDEKAGEAGMTRAWVKALQRKIIKDGYRGIEAELLRDLTMRYHRAYFRMRRAFGRLGVLVVRVDEGEPVQLVLNRLDRLRGVRRRR